MKKSKFLKKSLAMLLALMLVIAMIPLSASASALNLKTIVVGGASVDVSSGSATINVSTTAEEIEVGTNEDLPGWEGNPHELRVVNPNGVDEKVIDQWDNANQEGTPIDFKTYAVDNKITLKLYDLTTDEPNGTLEKTITLTLNKVVPSNSTKLAAVEPGLGVSKILSPLDEINETGVIRVLLARNNWATNTSTSETQAALNATIEVKGDGCSVAGTALKDGYYEVGADEKDSFTVSASGTGNTYTYTVIATYEDALTEFTVGGYKGTITDGDKDGIPDTITVNLPDSVLKDSNGFALKADPSLAVGYAVNGNVTNKVTVYVDGTTGKDVKSDGSVKVQMTGLIANDKINDNAYVVVTRLGKGASGLDNGAEQRYKLVVQMEKSSSTAITAVMVNNTAADISGDPITAVLPNRYYSNGSREDTDLTDLTVVITTDPTVSSVVLDGDDTVTGSLNAIGTAKTWTFTGVNLATEKIISVFSEDGKEMEQTGIIASLAEDVSSATITAFSLSDGVNTYPAESINNNVITVRVPYMTTDVSGWRMYAAPSAYAKVVGSNQYDREPDANGSIIIDLAGTPFDLINGTTTAAQIGLTSIADATSDKAVVSTGCLQAVALNNDTVKTTYTVNVVLEKAGTGKRLEGLKFTAQSDTNDTDREVFYAKTDANTFTANVAQATNANNYVGTINLKVAPSLTNKNDLGITFHNVITEISKETGAVVYGVVGNNSSSDYNLEEIYATTNGISDTALTGALIANDKGTATLTEGQVNIYNQIVVLPEQYARQVKLGTAEVSNGSNAKGWISAELVKKYGTLYNVAIGEDIAEDEAVLKTFKVGEVELTINADGTITGELPWSYTIASTDTGKTATVDEFATFAEFTMSDYALLTGEYDTAANADSLAFFSKGDWDGDGLPNPVYTPSHSDVDYWSNVKFLFVRNDDHTVDVYFVDNNTAARDLLKDQVTVRAENRLLDTDDSGDYAKTTYTFKLIWKDASNEAVISNFKLGNYTGTVSGHNITVQVPYGTDVTGLVATFDKSIGASIKVNDRVGGVELISGVTSVNYSNPVKLFVTSESGFTTVEYTVTVEEGISFSDVNAGDWFYDNVMDAANHGYVSGYPDGTYQPTKAITRAEFASMIAKAMGYTAEPDVASMFPDVKDDHWAKAAINFCAQNGIINGYDDLEFKPDQPITRQEAAAILNNAFELAEKYGISTEAFPDDSAIAGWAEDHVYAAKASGLMKGDAGTGNFRPTNQITRAEAASILMNANRAGLIK